MSYRIGSFNYYNFGSGNKKNLDTLYKMINEHNLDLVALQEVRNRNVLKRILSHLPQWNGFHDSSLSSSSPNDFAYIWNTKRLQCCSKANEPQVYKKFTTGSMTRNPYYGRFTSRGLPGGAFFEFRLINVHLHYGSSNAEDTAKRKKEYEVLSNEIYTRISKKRYGNFMPCYTVILGDYNMTLEWCRRQNVENQNIQAFQEELTTLKTSENDFSKSYDHFTYDVNRFKNVKVRIERLNSVRHYCGNDFSKHRNEVSDHVPIIIELDLKNGRS